MRFQSVIEVVDHKASINVQDAIDLAVKEDKIVRFTSVDSNLNLRKAIVDLKGCDVIKGTPEDIVVSIYPLSFHFLS